jgi:hypothetical protein
MNSWVHGVRGLHIRWSDYEVPGMILLRDLKATSRLARSKDMSVHVSTCTIYDFNALTLVVWKLWR